MNILKTSLLLVLIANDAIPVMGQQNTSTADTTHPSLANVTITADRPQIIHEPGRTICNIAGTVAASGTDGLETLNKLPGIQATDDGVRITGKGTVAIMIDNRLLQVSGEECANILRSIASENILRVEIITNPSSGYDATGNAGLIRIITKRPAAGGWSGNTNIACFKRQRNSEMLSAAAYFRTRKLLLYTTGLVRKNIFCSDITTNTNLPLQQQAQQMTQNNHAGYASIEIGTEYTFKPGSILTINGSARLRSRNLAQDYTTILSQPHAFAADSLTSTHAAQQTYGSNQTCTFEYSWQPDTTGNKLTISASCFTDHNHDNRDQDSRSYLPDGNFTGYTDNRYTNAERSINIQSLKADIDRTLSQIQLSFGLKTTFAANSIRQANTTAPNQATPDNNFQYREQTHAAYLSAQWKVRKVQTCLGLRTEYTAIGSSTATASIRNTYCKLFPTASIQLNAGSNIILSANYSRRIERPDFAILNPFKQYLTDLSYQLGNPTLQPAITDNIEMGIIRKRNTSATLYCTHKNNFISEVSMQDTGNNTYYYTSANTGSTTTFGFILNTRLQPMRRWQVNLQFTGFSSTLHTRYYTAPHNSTLPGCIAECSNTLTIGPAKCCVLELGCRYYSDQLSGIYLQYHYLLLWGGAKALLFDKQLVLALNCSDPFRSAYDRNRNIYNNYYTSAYFDRRFIQLSVNWKWGNRQVKQRAKQDLPEELKRAE